MAGPACVDTVTRIQAWNRTVTSTLLEGADVSSHVVEVLARSCSDRHSDGTRYPWYSSLPWVNRVIEADVQKRRERYCHIDGSGRMGS